MDEFMKCLGNDKESSCYIEQKCESVGDYKCLTETINSTVREFSTKAGSLICSNRSGFDVGHVNTKMRCIYIKMQSPVVPKTDHK